MNYNVGQVLYMTNPKNLKIIPIQIIEEVTRTTLNGTEKTFMVQFPDSKKTVADINTLSGDLYEDTDSLKSALIENATKSIEKMISVAKELASIEYNTAVEETNKDVPITQNVQVETNNDIITVDLGGGVKAKMKKTELEKVSSK